MEEKEVKRHTEVIERGWGTEVVTLIGKKGTRLFIEERENHIKGMMQYSDQGEKLLTRMEYLVFQFPDLIERNKLPHVKHYDGDSFVDCEGRSEIASFRFNFFSRGVIGDLERLGYLKRVWKTYPKEKGEYPIYVNAYGWRFLYNIGSCLATCLHKGFYFLCRYLFGKNKNNG